MTSYNKWNLWRIKSPWIRLPVAWLYTAASVPVVVFVVLTLSIFAAAKAAVECAIGIHREWPWRDTWLACTTWKAE